MAVSYPATLSNYVFRRIESNVSIILNMGQQMTVFKGDLTINGELIIDGEVMFL